MSLPSYNQALVGLCVGPPKLSQGHSLEDPRGASFDFFESFALTPALTGSGASTASTAAIPEGTPTASISRQPDGQVIVQHQSFGTTAVAPPPPSMTPAVLCDSAMVIYKGNVMSYGACRMMVNLEQSVAALQAELQHVRHARARPTFPLEPSYF